MPILEVVGRVADLSAIPVAIVGFGLTLWQLRKTRSAAEAARKAARSTQRNISRSSLLMLIPQLTRVEEEIDRAVQADSRATAISWLATWRWQAGQVRGLLMVNDLGSKHLLEAIQESITAASTAKVEFVNLPAGDLVLLTESVRARISDVINELSAVATVQGNTFEGDDDA